MTKHIEIQNYHPFNTTGETAMKTTTDNVTILTCREPNKLATKKFIVQKDGTIEKVSFGAGRHFIYEQKPVASIYDLGSVLTELLNSPQRFIIRGNPKPGAKQTVMRRINNPGAAFDPAPRHYVVMDIDKQACPAHLDPANNPEEVVKWVKELLPEPFKNATCYYKFSSSQNIPKNVNDQPPKTISIHLAFWCDRPVSEGEWKRYFKMNPAPVDLALFSPVQIHYTARPMFEGMDDPLPHRSGILKGDSDILNVPPIPEKETRSPIMRPENKPEVQQDSRDKAIELLLPYYIEGVRDRLSGGVAGALYRGGWEADDTADFVLNLAEAGGDPEATARYDSALRICDAVDGNRLAQGIPTLRDELNIDRLDEILELLGVGKPNFDGAIAKLSKASSPAEIETTIKLLLTLPVADQAILLDQIHKKTDQSKAAITKIFNTLKKENEFFYSRDRAVHMVESLLDDHYEGGRCLLKATDGNFWHFNGRHWETIPIDLLKKKLLPYAKMVADDDKRHVSSMLTAGLNVLSGRVFREGDPLRFHSDPPAVINCLNGELWFENGELSFKPHKPESYLRSSLNVHYDPAAKCPRFDTATLEIFSASTNPEDMFRHFMELVGYLCQTWRKLAIIVLLHGAGSNGKTSLVNIIQYIMGHNAITSDRISEIENNVFKIGALSGKLMLMDDDVDAGTCLPDGFLKKISEEKTMTGQHKYGPPFEFKCRAIPVMLSNHYPSLKDLSDGMRRRIQVIPFARKFTKEEAQPGLYDEIWEAEASGILNRAIAGYQRLRERGHFKEPEDCLRARQEWLVRSNVVMTFTEEVCKQGPDQKQPIRDFYERFQIYCRDTGVVHVPTQQGVKQRLESMGYELSSLNGYTVIRGLYAPDALEVIEPM